MILLAFLFIIFFAFTAFVEYQLRKSWDRTYFRVGIPIYLFRFKMPQNPPRFSEFIPNLQSHFSTVLYSPDAVIQYKSVGKYELFFYHYMRFPQHGRIHYDPHEQECIVRGYYSWTLLAMQLMLFSIFASDRIIGFTDILVQIALGIFLMIASYRFYMFFGVLVQDKFTT